MISGSSALITAQAQASAATSSEDALAERVTRLKQNKAKTEEQAHEVGEQFEAMFLSQMMSPMFEELDTDGMFGGGQSEKMFRSLLVDEYGKQMAKAGGIGIADAVARQILQIQEAHQ